MTNTTPIPRKKTTDSRMPLVAEEILAMNDIGEDIFLKNRQGNAFQLYFPMKTRRRSGEKYGFAT